MTSPPNPVAQPLTKAEDWIGVIPGMGRSAIYRAIQEGELPSIRVGRHLLIPTHAMLVRLGLAHDAELEAAQAEAQDIVDGRSAWRTRPGGGSAR